MRKKKICLVTNWYPTEDNPAQGLFFREQAIALADYYDFIVLHYMHEYQYAHSRFKEAAELRIVRTEYNITEYNMYVCASRMQERIKRIIAKRINYNKYLFSKICEQLSHESIDVFYTITGQTDGVITAKFASYFNKPYVISEHGPIPWPGTVLSAETKEAFENASLFLAISNDKIRQVLMQGIRLPRIWYVGNMVDDEKFICGKTKNAVRTFITVGANVFYKNYDMLIKTFDRLTEITDVSFKLIIVGYKANKSYSRDSTELEASFKGAKFRDRLELVPSVPHEEMPNLFARSDAFVMTSIQEGQPVSAIEAGCCGLPLFATRCGGIEDYVDESIGRIVELLDSDTLAGHLKSYLEGSITFNQNHIRSVLCSKFGKEAFVRNMVDAFESVMQVN